MSATGNNSNSDAPREPSDVRFGVRDLLLAMTAVAVALGILGSVYRWFETELRFNAMVLWGLSAAFIVGRLAYCVITRVRLERAAGRISHVLAPRGTFGGARRPWMTVLIGLFWIGLGLYFLAVCPLLNDGSQFLLAIGSGALISAGIQQAWWSRTVQLREHGVLRGLRLLRWSHITKHTWDGEAVIVQGIDQSHRDLEIEAVATAGSRNEMERLVEYSRASQNPLGVEVRTSSDGMAQRSTRVPIRARSTITAGGLGAAAAAYVMLCVMSFTLFGPSGASSHEYIRGVQLGIGAAILKLVFDAWRKTDSGAPLVRLFLKIDWPSILVATLVAAGCYYITQQMVFPSPWIAVPLGMVSGLAVSVVAGMLFREKVDLCENGVVLVRWPFLPWERVRVLKWKREGRGSLLLRSGWRRIRARVPVEHREVVDRVLRAQADRTHEVT
jgi:hypothetical protein